MAGIEKVCEFSGEYPGWEMKEYKHNLIQIMPKYRKLFKKKKAKLKFTGVEYMTRMGKNHCKFFSYGNEEQHKEYYKCLKMGLSKEDAAYVAFGRPWHRPALEYNYSLITDDPDLQGQVKGVYANYTYNKGTVRRKLQRLVGGKRYLKM